MNLDLWDIEDSILFKKQFSSSDPHDPIYYDQYLEDYCIPFEDDTVTIEDDDDDENDSSIPSEADPFDWFNERASKEYDV